MNDRTLLELAARAAGYKLSWSYDNHCCWINEMRHDLDVTWNPLTDDGDALRLAVKLGLILETDLDDASCSATDVSYDNYTVEEHGDCPNAAVRLAIVSCAAEIGKSMGGGE
ncbi:hypothetical protein [Pseudomonas aeruginosa]|uniref:hypothetical protein n=1 Tax=Pseudomonas aeruginosa TaxID=287 RepID=UPI00288094D6|nr:hypothetical protein [Pseudomonas aeruginosa]